jgi:hypothetical protein
MPVRPFKVKTDGLRAAMSEEVNNPDRENSIWQPSPIPELTGM